MRYYLGTHMLSQPWWDAAVPLFVSRRRLTGRRTLPLARAGWALDSGGFTELSMFGEWRTTEDEYVADVRRFEREVGRLEWVAPMDWMCEPQMLERTGLTVYHHQERTVENFRRLRDQLGALVIPVLQGWTLDEYLACWDEYAEQGVELADEPVVGLGTVCRRQDTVEASLIVRRITAELGSGRLHGFGVKVTGLESFGDVLGSADSMAWSYTARRNAPLSSCTHKTCQNCLAYALRWHEQMTGRLGQLRLEMAA